MVGHPCSIVEINGVRQLELEVELVGAWSLGSNPTVPRARRTCTSYMRLSESYRLKGEDTALTGALVGPPVAL